MESGNSEFGLLGIEVDLTDRLHERGFTTPTAIQSLAIPAILRGESLVAKSQTGSGKSIAYLLPLLQMVGAEQDESQMLVLTPTRELAQQVGLECKRISPSLAVSVIYGGVEYEDQLDSLRSKPQVVVATVGRLIDLLERGAVEFRCLRYFVLDEVDQMVDMGFRDGIVELARLRAEGAQTLCFSATMAQGVEEVIREVVGTFEMVQLECESLAVERIAQSGYFVNQTLMDQLLLHLLRVKSGQRTIVFCRSRKMADRLGLLLKEANICCEVIHSERSQKAREYILERFRVGETKVLVATDLVARGIDIKGVSHVFNFGLPQCTEQYIHRIGRTGRAGEAGEAISLVCPDEAKLLGEICAAMRRAIPMSTSHPYMTPDVTVALANGGGKSGGGKKSDKRVKRKFKNINR